MQIGKIKLFQKNVGKEDRIIRIILGLGAVVGSYLYLVPPVQYVGYLIAAILLFTGLMSTCMLYELFGINTNKK